eukprot:2052438-Amphidinium_carterae.1
MDWERAQQQGHSILPTVEKHDVRGLNPLAPALSMMHELNELSAVTCNTAPPGQSLKSSSMWMVSLGLRGNLSLRVSPLCLQLTTRLSCTRLITTTHDKRQV